MDELRERIVSEYIKTGAGRVRLLEAAERPANDACTWASSCRKGVDALGPFDPPEAEIQRHIRWITTFTTFFERVEKRLDGTEHWEGIEV